LAWSAQARIRAMADIRLVINGTFLATWEDMAAVGNDVVSLRADYAWCTAAARRGPVRDV
jgi:hypothetical protein